MYNSGPQGEIQKAELDLNPVQIMGMNDITEREFVFKMRRETRSSIGKH